MTAQHVLVDLLLRIYTGILQVRHMLLCRELHARRDDFCLERFTRWKWSPSWPIDCPNLAVHLDDRFLQILASILYKSFLLCLICLLGLGLVQIEIQWLLLFILHFLLTLFMSYCCLYWINHFCIFEHGLVAPRELRDQCLTTDYLWQSFTLTVFTGLMSQQGTAYTILWLDHVFDIGILLLLPLEIYLAVPVFNHFISVYIYN